MGVTGPGSGADRWRHGAGAAPENLTMLTVGGAFDAHAAQALRAELAASAAEGRRGCVVDLRAAGELDAGQQGLLLRIAAEAAGERTVVAIVRDPDALRRRIVASDRRLPVTAVASHADAAVAMRAGSASAANGTDPATSGDLAARHRRVVETSLHWAGRSAAVGDYGDAVGWLELARAVSGRLPAAWELRREQWERGLQAEDPVPPRPRPWLPPSSG